MLNFKAEGSSTGLKRLPHGACTVISYSFLSAFAKPLLAHLGVLSRSRSAKRQGPDSSVWSKISVRQLVSSFRLFDGGRGCVLVGADCYLASKVPWIHEWWYLVRGKVEKLFMLASGYGMQDMNWSSK